MIYLGKIAFFFKKEFTQEIQTIEKIYRLICTLWLEPRLMDSVLFSWQK